jgi:hypothetical protein
MGLILLDLMRAYILQAPELVPGHAYRFGPE